MTENHAHAYYTETHTHKYGSNTQAVDACGVCGGDSSSCGTAVQLTLQDQSGTLQDALSGGRLSDSFINVTDPVLQAISVSLGLNVSQLVLVSGATVSVGGRRATDQQVPASFAHACVLRGTLYVFDPCFFSFACEPSLGWQLEAPHAWAVLVP
jgi:hypothetical protein